MATASGKPRASFKRRLVMRLLFWTLAVLLICWLIFAFQRRFIFPRAATEQNPGAKTLSNRLVEVWIDTPEGKVEGWYLPGYGVSAERPGPAVIFAHGNAELIDQQPGDMEAYRRMGVSVLLPEYRGYGRSAGSPSQAAITDDFLKFHAWLIARPEVDPKKIIYHGRSLGGGALFALAELHPPAAVIAESTFTSIKARMAAHFIPSFLTRDPFDNLTVIQKLDCPILLMHGQRDSIIPHADSVALQAAAKSATLISFDTDHNDPFDPEVYWGHIESFLRSGKLIP